MLMREERQEAEQRGNEFEFYKRIAKEKYAPH